MRLQRIGKKGQAYFRVVVTEHTKKPQGEFLELLGSYDPHKKDLKLKKDRVDYWLTKGVQPSPTVNNLLVNNKIISAPKMQSWRPKPNAKPAPTAAAPAEALAAPEPEAAATEEKPAE